MSKTEENMEKPQQIYAILMKYQNMYRHLQITNKIDKYWYHEQEHGTLNQSKTK